MTINEKIFTKKDNEMADKIISKSSIAIASGAIVYAIGTPMVAISLSVVFGGLMGLAGGLVHKVLHKGFDFISTKLSQEEMIEELVV